VSAIEAVRALGGDGVPDFMRGVEDRLAAATRATSGLAADAASETLAAGGKRLRPLLVYLSAPLAGRDAPALVAAATAVELVHMATLVHDDVLDAAPLRRGRPTVWAAHGQLVASAAGDYLFARAFAELAATRDAVAVATLARATLELAHGEAMQDAQTRQPDTPVAAYLERCRRKTGRLFAAACALGGRLGGLDEAGVAALDRFGVELGLAFQLADDVLDCDGDPARTGKALGTDLLEGVVTLPLLLAAAREPSVAAALRDRARPGDVLELLGRVRACGALSDARASAQAHARAARRSIDGLRDRCDTDALAAIVQRAVERDS